MRRIKMTNRQWLESLSNEELARTLDVNQLAENNLPDHTFGIWKEICDTDCYHHGYCCNHCFMAWLRAEHKEVEE